MTVINTDFVVVGSGAAGLAAAATAAHTGQRVVVLERSDKIGGTSCLSGGQLWAPMNHLGHKLGLQDSPTKALAYIRNASDGSANMELSAVYVDEAVPTLRFLESVCGLKLRNGPFPDSLAEVEGGVERGRHLEPALYRLGRLGKAKTLLRCGPSPMPITIGEVYTLGLMSDMRGFVRRMGSRVLWRMLWGYRGAGQALMAPLFNYCLKQGVTFRLNEQGVRLIKDERGRVTALVARQGEVEHRHEANKGVILACGGFEWDEELVSRYLPIRLEALPTARTSLGDNVRLAQQVGASIAGMDEPSLWPVGKVPGVTYEGADIGLIVSPERSFPHTFIVNRFGRRFANETLHNFDAAFLEKDPESGEPVNLPCWAVFDSQYRKKYPLLGMKVKPGGRDPDWLVRAASLPELAELLGIDGDNLQATTERFNTFACNKKDEDFGRGESAYERFCGDPRAAHPCLGEVSVPPFYAIRIYPGATGTHGGPVIDQAARVLDREGQLIPGLYAAGNASAGFLGRKKIAAGDTLLPAMVFARLAVLDAVKGSKT